MERLTYRGSETMTEDGLITPSYSDYSTRRIIERLAEYEDLDEQGLLLRLPCKAGASVYVIPTYENGFNRIVEMSLLGYSISEPCNVMNLFSKNRFDKSIPKMYQPSINDFGKTVFLTQAEAEQKLKEMESD